MDYKLIDADSLIRLAETLGDPRNWDGGPGTGTIYIGPEAEHPWEIVQELFQCLEDL